jgi:hypothetical protein
MFENTEWLPDAVTALHLRGVFTALYKNKERVTVFISACAGKHWVSLFQKVRFQWRIDGDAVVF